MRDSTQTREGCCGGATPNRATGRRTNGLIPARRRTLLRGTGCRTTRIVLSAQFKAGKTTLVVNLVRTLVDGGSAKTKSSADHARGRINLGERLDDEDSDLLSGCG
jgi:hypothetical protein